MCKRGQLVIVREVREPCCPPLTPAVPNGIAIVIEIFAANAAEEAADTLDDISAARCVRFLFFIAKLCNLTTEKGINYRSLVSSLCFIYGSV